MKSYIVPSVELIDLGLQYGICEGQVQGSSEKIKDPGDPGTLAPIRSKLYV
ncbi:MAG: hypothetical protein MJZ64_06135 [Paludibacteraceae bacterium]|nr:hypothetical protein [Paludibacteraceae bacterium]